ERDDRGATWQPGDLPLAGKRKLRQTRTGQNMRTRKQPLHHRPHWLRPEHQRLLAAATVKHAVGEDMAALEISGELHLVDGKERDIELARHRLNRANPITRVGRLDLFLTGDERHG